MNKFWIALAPIVALGCTDIDKDGDTGDSGVDDTGEVLPDDPTVTVSWGADAVDITVDGGPGGYWLGMAQDGSSDNWTGEDCIYGYELQSGSILGPYCHEIGDPPASVSLTYGGDVSNLQTGTTVFTDESAANGDAVTYILISDANYGGDGSCWVWGANTSYYAEENCTEL